MSDILEILKESECECSVCKFRLERSALSNSQSQTKYLLEIKLVHEIVETKFMCQIVKNQVHVIY